MGPPYTPPFSLKVLGAAAIEGPDGPITGRAAQRHRLALLALLATTPDGMTRDKAVALLWPEREASKARHALSDSIYRINHAIGREAVVAGGNRDLRLDADALPSDLVAFRRALEGERWEGAADAYGGPFLDGFHLSGSPEFERWVDGERHRLARCYAEALEALAEECAQRGDLNGAAAAWRRRAAVDRYDSRVAIRLMEALAAAGNPAAAIRHASIHAELLEREFGAGPDPDVVALAERIRNGRYPAAGVEAAARNRRPHDGSGDPGPAAADRAAGPAPSALPSGPDGVHAVANAAATSESDAAEAGPRPGVRHDRGANRSRGIGLGTAGALTVVLAGLWVLASRSPPANSLSGERPASAAERVALRSGADGTTASIAVLAFEDLSAEGDQAWFADGITEEITHGLVRVEGLRVLARQSSFAFRDGPEDVRRIADTLGVAYIVDGSVRRGGDSAWVSVQLVDGATGFQRWSRTYATTPSAERLHSIQNRIARSVATALSLQVRGAPESRDVIPGDSAYDAYLEGRFHLRRFQSGGSEDPRTILRSIGYLERVVEAEPRWAPGWAALGEAHHWAAFEGMEPRRNRIESKRALEVALALDPDHAQANASLGYVLHRLDHDYEAAEAHLRRALTLDSEQYWHCGYTLFLLWAGRYDEAVDAGRRAQAHDPMFEPLKVLLASAYRCAGRLEDAVRQARVVLSETPDAVVARRELALALERSGRVGEALAVLDDPDDPSHPYLELIRVLVLARDGRAEEAEALLSRTDTRRASEWANDVWASRTVTGAPAHAAALVALGRPDAAIDVLETAMDRDPDTLLYDRCYPELRSLEGDARYQALLRRTGVPE